MATLDSLSADQHAVLALVLQRGRSYDDIARLLAIDPTAVRQRALAAFDALGPQTAVSDQRRALITDYLLGQLPPQVGEQTRNRLAETASERAWARAVASEVAPLAGRPLPEIPAEGSPPPAPAPPDPEVPPTAPPQAARGEARPDAEPEPAAPRRERQSIFKRKAPREAAEHGAPAEHKADRPVSARTSRRGGALILAAVAVIAIAVVVVVVFIAGGSSKRPIAATATTRSTPASAAAPTTTTAPTATTSSTTAPSPNAAHVVAAIKLTSPAAGSKAAGIAEVLKEGATNGIAIVAQNIPANATKPPNAYAVWLYNSPTDAHILGFVNPGVSATGRLSTAGGLPANAKRFKDLIVTVETKANPTRPGGIILRGTLAGLS